MSEHHRIADYITQDVLEELSLPSNLNHGNAIFLSGGVQFIERGDLRCEAWVGGKLTELSSSLTQRRRTTLFIDVDERLAWRCTCNSKKSQIFCKHCVALSLALLEVPLNL